MLRPADASLVARDPRLPGLAVLLDADALASVVGAPVEGGYLRYKPGTSCVLSATAALPGGPAEVVITAYDDDGEPKLAKALARGHVVAIDPSRRLVVVRAAADRDLPALERLLGDDRARRRVLRTVLPGRSGTRKARLDTLRYKPARRWVAKLTGLAGGPVALRAYRPADAAAAAARYAQLGGQAGLPALLGVDAPLGVVAVEWMSGERVNTTDAASLRATGKALAELHQTHAPRLPALADESEAVTAALELVAVLLPDDAPATAALAGRVAQRLAELPPSSVTAHGDFSLDQVVRGDDGRVRLLDLDRAGCGDPAADLGSLRAAVIAEGAAPDALLGPLLAGYAEVRPLPPPDAVAVHTAARLARRAAEPFRLRAPDWPARTRALLAAAARLVDDPLALPVTEVIETVVGTPVRLRVLKDKPGRRRTCHASGPGGSAIVKVYASRRAPVVAARVRALRGDEARAPAPLLPTVLHVDEDRHLLVLSEVPGQPFAPALLAGDREAAQRVGTALATWHAAFRGRVPRELAEQTAQREHDILLRHAARAPEAANAAVAVEIGALCSPWTCDTVVHRDLYEDQIVLGERVGLLDLDDTAAGPAELDLGNLVAHVALLGRRRSTSLLPLVDRLLAAYRDVAPLDDALLARCARLSQLRLACLHRDPELLTVPTLPFPAVERSGG